MWGGGEGGKEGMKSLGSKGRDYHFFANLQVKFDFANLKKSRCCRSFRRGSERGRVCKGKINGEEVILIRGSPLEESISSFPRKK